MHRTTLGLALTFGTVLALPAVAGAAACSVTAGDLDGNGTTDLQIVGNAARQKLVLEVDPVGAPGTTKVWLDCNYNGVTPNYADSPALGDVNGVSYVGSFDFNDIRLGGADDITIKFFTDWTGAAHTFQLTLGYGNNAVTIDGAGVTLRAQSRLLVNIGCYTQNDVIKVTAPALDASGFVLRTDFSSGIDSLALGLSGDLTNGAMLDSDSVSGLGSHAVSFAQNGKSIVASTVLLNVEGADNADNVTTTLDGVIDAASRVSIGADLAAGTDTFTANFALTSFRLLNGSELLFDVAGGYGNDIIKFTRNGTSGGATTINSGRLDIRADGGGNDDLMVVDLAGGGLQMNGGAVALRLNGGGGNDTITVALEAEAGSTNPLFDVAVLGGTGGDKLTVSVLNASAFDTAANYGPQGMVLLDGGYGTTDVCVPATTTGFIHVRNCP
jgi:hypothetical protein